jgi:hypothetical protein
MTWPLWLGLLLAFLALSAAGVSAYGSKRWTDATRVLRRSLEAARTDGEARSASAARFDSRELEDLPAPVQRYFRAVLKEGQPIISALTIEMVGSFNMSTAAEHWKPFTSRQRVATHRPGFLWDAQVSMVPGLVVRVVDSYIAGSGLLHAAILGLVTVAKVSGGGEVARGEFMRFFAEAAWYPTALLPSQGMRWEAVDDRSANATIVDGPLTLTLLFRFNHAGLIDSVRAEARGAMVGNKVVMMPWECSLSSYEVREGMTVPITGEASWVRPEGRKPYFRGTITSLTYEFVPS